LFFYPETNNPQKENLIFAQPIKVLLAFCGASRFTVVLTDEKVLEFPAVTQSRKYPEASRKGNALTT
jgi:hypothetical protein